MNAGFIGRIASAVLIGAFGIGIGGAGTASAASSPDSSSGGAHISIMVNTPANPQIRPGSIFTDTIVVTNDGQHPANNVKLMLPYDPAQMQLVDVKIDRDGAWVTNLASDGFQAYLGRLSSNGDAITLSARFMALPSYHSNSVITSMLGTNWSDARGERTSETQAMLTPTLSGASAPLTMSSPVAIADGKVQVYSAGFSAGESVSFWYNAPDGSVVPLYLNNGRLTTDRRYTETASDGSTDHLNNAQYLVADANGTITTWLSVDGWTNGNYSIVAHGATNGHQTVIPFMVGQ